jgi:2-aminobenzoylacetyl-CoA thioesterase
MWIDEPGEISAHATMLGKMTFPCYLIQSERTALIDAGVTSLSPLFEETFSAGKTKPDFILLTHSHFDHVGGLGVLRRLAPRAVVVGSLTASNLLARRKVYDFILDMNRGVEKLLGPGEPDGKPIPLHPEDLRVDMVVGEGEIIDLGGGVTLEVHLTPGHTKCSVAYLLKPDGVLFGGDGLGAYLGGEEVGSQFTSNYKHYLASLRKIEKLKVEALALPHQGVLTGADASKHIQNAIRSAEVHFAQIQQLIQSGKSTDQITDELFESYYKGLAASETEQAFRINLVAMTDVVRKESGNPT